jgi:hypothetical protein
MVRRTVALATVLAVVTAGVALASATAVYKGTTSQKLPISLTLRGFKVVRVSYTAKEGSCGALTTTGKVSLKIKGSGFAGTVKPDSETKLTIRGTFGAHKTLHGTLTDELTEGGIHPHTCTSGRVTYRAALK